MIPFCASPVTFVSGLVWGQGQRVGPFVPRALCTAPQLMEALSQAAGPETCSPTGRADTPTREVGEICGGWGGWGSCSAGEPTSEVFTSPALVSRKLQQEEKKALREALEDETLVHVNVRNAPLLSSPLLSSPLPLLSNIIAPSLPPSSRSVSDRPSSRGARCLLSGRTWSLGGRRLTSRCYLSEEGPTHLAVRVSTLSLPAAWESIFSPASLSLGEEWAFGWELNHTWLW